ncbi:MAG TPA: metallophosphoesterase family protein [Verrucomicrobiae bacterium]|nr:metallophosphoesterase family protein [Verrucomicrobiae bacterium]
MKIGVISDTHNFWDPKIPERFAGVDHILHAGDVGLPWILRELERVAPVTAVSGNTDDAALGYGPVKTVELAGRKFFIQHIVRPHDLSEPLQQRLARERPDVVVFGHTHRRFCESIGGVLYFNPGYAGQPKWGVERSVAILDGDGKEIRAEYFEL